MDSCLLALSGLTRLTCLQLDCIRQLSLLQHLPGDLQQLAIKCIPWADEDDTLEVSLDMSHLSNLRSLRIQAEYHDLTLAADCRLPRSLTALTVPNAIYCSHGGEADGGGSSSSSNACVLLQLTKLQQLALDECSLTADATVQISSALTALTEVRLAYSAAACTGSAFGSEGSELVAAAAWARLPLVSLSFGLLWGPGASSLDGGDGDLDSFVGGDSFGEFGEGGFLTTGLMLEQLGQLTGLTSLRIYGLGHHHHHHVTNQVIASMPSTPHLWSW
jgi:hypothetical protein